MKAAAPKSLGSAPVRPVWKNPKSVDVINIFWLNSYSCYRKDNKVTMVGEGDSVPFLLPKITSARPSRTSGGGGEGGARGAL